jgi:nucleoside diphosphate kinase
MDKKTIKRHKRGRGTMKRGRGIMKRGRGTMKRGRGTMKRGGTLFNDFNDDTGLLRICSNSSKSPPLSEKTKIALQLIETKGLEEGYLGQINEDGDTALLLACSNDMNEVALKLTDYKVDQVNPGQINKDGDTALIWACFNKMDEVALELIKFGDKVNPGQISDDQTALLLACRNNMTDVALLLITEFGDKVNPGQINNSDNTALLLACRNKMTEVALELITKFGDKVNPGQIKIISKNNIETALICACRNNMPDVILELFKIYIPSQSEIQFILHNLEFITDAYKKQILDNLKVKEVTLELPPNYIIEDIIYGNEYSINDLKEYNLNKILKKIKDKKEDDPHTYIIYSFDTKGIKGYKIVYVKVSTLNSLKENEQGLGIHTGHTIHTSLLEYIKNQPYNIYLLDFDDETIKPYILKKIVGFSEKETSQSPQKKNSSQSPQKKNSSHSSSDEY